MGNLLEFETHHRQKAWKQVAGQFNDLNAGAAQLGEEYGELAVHDPNQALDLLPSYINQVRNVNPNRHFVEAIAGGPNQDWIAPVINIVGSLYPYLDRPKRRTVLSHYVGFLDGIRWDYAQDHVALVDEPWLASDVVITRPIYNPGYQRYCDLLRQHPQWQDLVSHFGNVSSSFWMAMAVARAEYAPPDIQINFQRLFPTLMDRTADAIAGKIAEDAKATLAIDNQPIEQTVEEKLFLFDKTLIPKIQQKITEEKWVNLNRPE